MDWREQQRLAKLAAMEAEKMRLFAKVPNTAPIDPFDLAVKCGCEVRFMSLASLEGVYSPEPRPAIVIGSERPAGRRAYTCAHELGHHAFKHGMRIEELDAQKQACSRSPEEFLADVFAGFLLMSQSTVCRALKDRGWEAACLFPEQVYCLASYFGVGYGAVVNHLAYSLRMIPRESAVDLLKTKPKQIKEQYGAKASSEVVLVDRNWLHRAVDLEAGDTVVVPQKTSVEPGERLQLVEENADCKIYRAVSSGFTRVFCQNSEWAVNVRISRKNYEGLAKFRFLEEMEDD